MISIRRFVPSLSRALNTLAFLALPVASCFGASVTYWTPDGSITGGQPVDATVVFTTSAGNVHIEITNNQIDPQSVVQNVSGINFILSGGQTVGSLTSSAGVERNVDNDGTYTDGASVSTGWALLNDVNGGLKLNVLGTGTAPEHTIIGSPDASDVYGNANTSIAGNDAHNPFLAGTVVFDIEVAGVTENDTIDGATFFFGTTDGTNHVELAHAPEPITTSLVGVGLLALGVVRRLRSRK
jgi:hypothetical protein